MAKLSDASYLRDRGEEECMLSSPTKPLRTLPAIGRAGHSRRPPPAACVVTGERFTHLSRGQRMNKKIFLFAFPVFVRCSRVGWLREIVVQCGYTDSVVSD